MGKLTDEHPSVLNRVLFWTLILAALGLLFLVAGLPVIRQCHTMDVMVRQMTERNRDLSDRLDRMEKERIALVEDAFYVEKIARRNLNLCRPGEMQVSITPTSYDQNMRSAEHHITTAQPVGLWRLYGSLDALAEDHLLRRVALILSGLTGIAALALFGRSDRRRQAA